MKSSLSATGMHRQYNERATTSRRQIVDATLRVKFAQEADVFLRVCTLGIWQRDGASPAPRYVEYYSAIYTKGNPAPSILSQELSAAVSEYLGFWMSDLSARVWACDRVSGTRPARRFIGLVTLVLLFFAAVDDVVSEEGAGFVNTCIDTLFALCDQDDPKGKKAPLDVKDLVTRWPAPPRVDAPTAVAAPVGAEQAAAAAGEEAEPVPNLEELITELDGLCSLDRVKADVGSLINLVEVHGLRQEHGLSALPASLRLVFLGNPGTGETTTTHLLAKIYRAVGVLSKGQFVGMNRFGLVAGFMDQTAFKVGKVIEKTLSGVLFIDEIYALANRDAPSGFGWGIIEALLKGMEDHWDGLIVIATDYIELMGRSLHTGPGLENHFNKYFYSEDYSGAQLPTIFQSMCAKNGYTLDDKTVEYTKSYFKTFYEERDENFGNARDVRDVFKRAVARQSDRMAALERSGKEGLMTLTAADLREEGGPVPDGAPDETLLESP